MSNAPVLDISIAQSLHTRCQSFSLVYVKYLESGFISPHLSGLFFSLLDVQPTSTCWIITEDDSVVGTMSMVLNSTAGLPSGPTFERDLRVYGVDGRVIAEFTKLAISDQVTNASSLVLDLMARMIAWSWTQHIDDIVCVVHPRHARTWSHVFGWRVLGDVKGHGGVNNNPGVLLHLDLKRVGGSWRGLPPRGQALLDKSLKRLEGHSPIFRPSGAELVALLLQRPQLLHGDYPAQRVALERHFPWAMRTLRQLFEVKTEIEEDLFPSPDSRPVRDRSVLLPNQLWRLERNNKVSSHFTDTWDQLMYPDSPLVLLLGNKGLHPARLIAALERAGYVVFFREVLSEALTLIEENLFDIVLINEPALGEEILKITNYTRERDRVLGLHTPIIGINELAYEAMLRVHLMIPSNTALLEGTFIDKLMFVLATMVADYPDENIEVSNETPPLQSTG